ncbi:MAG TPA: site-specific integrase [Clostridia bacterium]|nr:site-specific integrase [Clostridia bacterium]
MPGLKKRKDNRFVRTVTVEGTRHFIYGKTAEEAADNLAEFKRKLKKGIALNDKTTVGEMATKWYDAHIKKNKKLALKTKEMYKYIINEHVTNFSEYVLSDVKPIMIEEYLNGLGKSKSLEHKIRITLGQIFKAAKVNKLIEDNPIEYVKPIAPDDPKREFLEEIERNIVLDALEGSDRAYRMVQAFLYTGMRLGEAVALTWKDIDKDNNTITISKAAEFDKEKTNLKGPKTKAGNRTIPVPEEIIKLLLEDKGNSIYVFPQVNGKMHTQYSIYSFWKRIQDRIEKYIKEINESKSDDEKVEMELPTFRTLRHTYATALYDAGVDIKYAQYLLGHEDVQITLNIYTHISKFKQSKNAPKVYNLYQNNKPDETPTTAEDNG